MNWVEIQVNGCRALSKAAKRGDIPYKDAVECIEIVTSSVNMESAIRALVFTPSLAASMAINTLRLREKQTPETN